MVRPLGASSAAIGSRTVSTGLALTLERTIAASSVSPGSAEARRPAACSKSRIAASVFGP